MPVITAIADFIKDVFKNHKMKIAFSIASALIFAVLRFPYDDLGGLATSLVAKHSQNKVYLQFDKLGLHLIPISFAFNNVEIETPSLPTIKADRMLVAPNIPKLLAFGLGANVSAEGLYSGDLDLTYGIGDTLESGDALQEYEFEYVDFRIEDLPIVDTIPMKITGTGELQGNVTIDPGFRDQPDGEATITLTNVEIPPSTIPTQMGPLALPTLKFSKVTLNGRIVGGEFIIEEAFLGDTNDNLRAAIKGKIGMRFVRRGPNVFPEVGTYEIRVQMDVKGQLPSELALFASFIDKFKTATNTGSRYLLKLNGRNFLQPPQMSALRSL